MEPRFWTALLLCLCAPSVCAAQAERGPMRRLATWFSADEVETETRADESTADADGPDDRSIERSERQASYAAADDDAADDAPDPWSSDREPPPLETSRRSAGVTTRRQLLNSSNDLTARPAPNWYPGSRYDMVPGEYDDLPRTRVAAGRHGIAEEALSAPAPMANRGASLTSTDEELPIEPSRWTERGLADGSLQVDLPRFASQESFGGPVFTPESSGPVVATPLFGDVLEEEYYAFEHPPVPYHEQAHSKISRGGWWFRDRIDDFFGKGECDNPWRRLFYLGAKEQTCDVGIGRDRVALAPFAIDLVQPFNHFRLRYDAVYDLRTPDRANYFWAKPGQGPPAVGEVVDYQEARLYSEIGGGMASAFTDIGLRAVDPLVAGNTTGFSDMTAGAKLLLVDGTYWKIGQITKTHMNTGSPRKGLGRGSFAMEPGVLARYKWNDDTYLHSQLTFWFPLGADPAFAGQILHYGLGVSYLGCETDRFALIHTAEWTGMTFIDGQTSTLTGVRDVDGEMVNTFLYGLRAVIGPAGDLGLFEAGVAGGFGTGSNWIDGMLRMELRWSY